MVPPFGRGSNGTVAAAVLAVGCALAFWATGVGWFALGAFAFAVVTLVRSLP